MKIYKISNTENKEILGYRIYSTSFLNGFIDIMGVKSEEEAFSKLLSTEINPINHQKMKSLLNRNFIGFKPIFNQQNQQKTNENI